ncbi:DUF6053 domain-containing protein, partial [Lysobacter enzymogenes]|uniref:DUF6053 domain-containing protein n=1 Tax=Lysobacter enzymogenes TaxID=69 RepID=UPI003D18FA7E
MGGPSGPKLFAPLAAIWAKSLGPEGPPTKKRGLKASPTQGLAKKSVSFSAAACGICRVRSSDLHNGAKRVPMGRGKPMLRAVRGLRVVLLSLACSAALSAQAQGAPARVEIPAGDLSAALDALARQSGAQFVYSADQLRGLRTAGVSGTMPAGDALDRLLRGSGFVARRDPSGGMVIVKDAAKPKPAAAAAAR